MKAAQHRCGYQPITPGQIALLVGISVVFTACPQNKAVEDFPDEYSGIGVELALPADLIAQGEKVTPVVTNVFPNSPAAEAGIQKGDTIIAINEKPTRGKTLNQLVKALRRKTGSKISLKVRRDDKLHWIRMTTHPFKRALPSTDAPNTEQKYLPESK